MLPFEPLVLVARRLFERTRWKLHGGCPRRRSVDRPHFESAAPSVRQLYPSYVTEGLREALEAFDARMPGFVCGEALLHGVETRTSSPVQVRGLRHVFCGLRDRYVVLLAVVGAYSHKRCPSEGQVGDGA